MKYSLPDSSKDLIIQDDRLLMRSLSVYEVLRRFKHIIRLTPFRFEDFLSALSADEQSPLVAEIHIQLLKTLLREDRQQQTWLCPPDLRDAVNIYLQLADHATYPAALRIYLSADLKENATILNKFQGEKPINYPLETSLEAKLDVLEHLCDQFLLSNLARDEIVNGTNSIDKHDNICRLCSKANGDLIACEYCPAVYHLKCSDPPLDQYPDTENGDQPYICAICRSNHVTGVSDCMDPSEKSGNLKRLDVIGVDKTGRCYWFLVRRLFVVDDKEEDVRYYTTIEQLDELIGKLKTDKGEKHLAESLEEQREEIERQMKITHDLCKSLIKNNDSGLNGSATSKFLGQEGTHKNYVNHYSSNNLALGKNQHSDRDINRTLGNKFSINSLNSFKWQGAIDGYLSTLTVTLRSTILKFESMIPHTFVHPCWQTQRNTWIRSINFAHGPQDYAIALSQLECTIKPVLFKSVWHESVGFSQLFRSTLAEREELKKSDRQPRGFERREWFSQDFEVSYRLGTMVKFSTKLKPIKHQVWKQKGEEYRLTGMNGWLWHSCTFKSRARQYPKLYRTEPYRLLSVMSYHPFLVDMVEKAINQSDVIDVATHLSKDEASRLLYPKKPLLNEYKRSRVSKLDGLLGTKLKKIKDSDESRNNHNNINNNTPTSQTDNLNNGSAEVKKIKVENGNGNKSISTRLDGGDNQTVRIGVPGAGDCQKLDIVPLTNGNSTTSKPDEPKKIIFYTSSQTPVKSTSISIVPSINLVTPTDKKREGGISNEQMVKKSFLIKPKLPPCHDFLTKRTKIRSLLVLPALELHKLARSGGLKETKSFSYTAKQNNYIWPYGMTPRPTFRTCWLYKNRIINSIQDVALQLKVIFASLRWEDLQVKAPASGHNTITTDDSTITVELLKKRDKLPYLSHSEYLIRKTITPIEQPTKYRKIGVKKSTPSGRTGLRARRQTEEEKEKGPTSEEVWVPEEQLELWELRQFDEKIERQNQLMRERALREEADRRRKVEEEKRRKADQERRRRAEEQAKKARLAAAQATSTQPNSTIGQATNLLSPQGPSQNNSINIAQPRSLPTTPVLRYFRTEQGQIIRLPASYLQRGTPLILRHVGPGPNQTNTYIIRPQITPVTTNIVIRSPVPTTPSTPATPVAAAAQSASASPSTPVLVQSSGSSGISTSSAPVLTTSTGATSVTATNPVSAMAKQAPSCDANPNNPSTGCESGAVVSSGDAGEVAMTSNATGLNSNTIVCVKSDTTNTGAETSATQSTVASEPGAVKSESEDKATNKTPPANEPTEDKQKETVRCKLEKPGPEPSGATGDGQESEMSALEVKTPAEAQDGGACEPRGETSVGTVVNKMAHDQHAPNG